MVSPVTDTYTEAALYLPKVFIELSAQICQNPVVRWFQQKFYCFSRRVQDWKKFTSAAR